MQLKELTSEQAVPSTVVINIGYQHSELLPGRCKQFLCKIELVKEHDNGRADVRLTGPLKFLRLLIIHLGKIEETFSSIKPVSSVVTDDTRLVGHQMAQIG